jgi:hypothetical protein
VRELQGELSRWPATYYSKGGKEPLLYGTVLLLSLQFRAALHFLHKDDMARALRGDAVHLAIALQVRVFFGGGARGAGCEVGGVGWSRAWLGGGGLLRSRGRRMLLRRAHQSRAHTDRGLRLCLCLGLLLLCHAPQATVWSLCPCSTTA